MNDMKNETTGKEGSSAQDDSERLARDLETLYRQVAALDTPDAVATPAHDLTSCYESLQISLDATLPEISRAYERMLEAWRADRYPHVESWEEKSSRKRREIRKAYENIMLFHSATPADNEERKNGDTVVPRVVQVEQTDVAPALTPLFSGQSTPSLDASEESIPLKQTPGKSVRRLWLLPVILLAVAAAALLFFWPELYHYKIIAVGDQHYPLRIHRITGDTAYFNGREWTSPPLKMASPSKSSPNPSPPENRPPASVPEMDFRKEEKTPPPPLKEVVERRELDSARNATRQIYRVQIMAYPDRSRADNLAEKLRERYRQVKIQAATLPGKGVWHRVLVGEFADYGAAQSFLDKEKFSRNYPGSFVQITRE